MTTDTRATTTTEPTIEIRRAARATTGAHNSCPVVLVEGAAAPRLVGADAYYTTAAGTVVRSPSAYARKSYARLVRHPSTLRVEVGADWRP